MVSEKIRILLIKRKMTMSELADKIETTPQNLSNKLSRDNFNEKEMHAIAKALGCKLDVTFEIDETGEMI
ncbi:helix-turn-helix transcriptional regulator [Chakrabartyella piscis]|uniref:helix-turn-helix transcriptional regulator n=1 Tax=Chakrabartyella piscis TaxID=2918914 RepID=UPI0029585DB1|nr:helix-turn-helix transcriptional regulator [Chakrabartyella piscis]